MKAQSIGDSVASFGQLANAQTEDQFRRLATALQSAREAERTALARELHDELGQTLTSLKLELARMAKELITMGMPLQMIDRLQSIVGNVELSIESVRHIATELRPPALDHLGLVAAIEVETATLARRTGLRFRIVTKHTHLPLTPEQQTAVFRIVQEALTNVVRHANASAVKISLAKVTRAVRVQIEDNGRGMTPDESARPSSIGLLGMRERAELVGGRLAIIASPGKGTTIRLTMPIAPVRRHRMQGGS
jgi:signal transduction histidine kinase